MRSILEWLGRASAPASDPAAGDTASVRRIVAKLEDLEPERARRVAAFAYLLGRVAHADLDISDEETAAMEKLVREVGQLPDDQALLVVEIAKMQNKLFGGTESFRVAREYRELTAKDERERLLHCLFAVSAADDVITGPEEAEVRKIAEELGFSHREFITVRSQYNDRRSVIQGLPSND
ncbi:MAG: TerB family tellurite resistance protein [Acidobacteriota bacterium]